MTDHRNDPMYVHGVRIMGGPFPEMRPAPGEHHVRNGTTFQRTTDGAVVVRQWRKEQDGWHVYSLSVPPWTADEWDSLVRFMASPAEEPKR